MLPWAACSAGESIWGRLPRASQSSFSAFYAELLARLRKAPGVLFFIPSVIPLVPGSNLYYTMHAMAVRDWPTAKLNAVLTLEYALAIALGLSVMWALLSMIRKLRHID